MISGQAILCRQDCVQPLTAGYTAASIQESRIADSSTRTLVVSVNNAQGPRLLLPVDAGFKWNLPEIGTIRLPFSVLAFNNWSQNANQTRISQVSLAVTVTNPSRARTAETIHAEPPSILTHAMYKMIPKMVTSKRKVHEVDFNPVCPQMCEPDRPDHLSRWPCCRPHRVP